MSDDATKALDYAPSPPGRRRWLVRSSLVLATAVLATFGIQYQNRVAGRFRDVRLRHAALSHRAPPDSVVMTQLPGDTFATWGATTGARYARPNPVWRDAERYLIPSPVARPGSSATLFLHERAAATMGKRRLVAINMARTWQRGGTVLGIDVRLLDPGSMFSTRFREMVVGGKDDVSGGVISGFPGAVVNLGRVDWGSDFRMFAAQPDPTDASRFTIAYAHEGVSGLIIGRLNDDDSVTFESKDGRALPLHFRHDAAATTTSPTGTPEPSS